MLRFPCLPLMRRMQRKPQLTWSSIQQVCVANLREPCSQCGMIRRSSTHSTKQWRSTRIQQVCVANLPEPCPQCGMIRRSPTHGTKQWRITRYDFARALLESLNLDRTCTPKKNMCVGFCYSLKLLEKIIMRFLKPSVFQTFPWEMVLLLDLDMLNWCKKRNHQGFRV